MCSGQERISSLLAKLDNDSVDASQLASLPAYALLTDYCSNNTKYCSRVNKKRDRSCRNKENKTENTADNENKNNVVTPIKQLGIFSHQYTFPVLIFSICLGVIYNYQLHTPHGFSKFWLWWENIDLQAEQCTIEMPPTVQDIFRPPVDCSMCENIKEIERIESVSSELFEQRYAYTGRPVVIIDGQINWTASKVFSFNYFRSIYAEDSPVLENFERDCQFFPYRTEFRNLREVFNMSDERSRKPWYIGWSNCDSSAANLLREHYERPYFFPESAESSKTDWIFMGTPGYGAHLHIDHVGNPSWQAQIRGKKLWNLEPPPECFFSCQGMEVVVHPGEIIVLDTNIWYHKTKIVSEDISITIGSEYD